MAKIFPHPFYLFTKIFSKCLKKWNLKSPLNTGWEKLGNFQSEEDVFGRSETRKNCLSKVPPARNWENQSKADRKRDPSAGWNRRIISVCKNWKFSSLISDLALSAYGGSEQSLSERGRRRRSKPTEWFSQLLGSQKNLSALDKSQQMVLQENIQNIRPR